MNIYAYDANGFFIGTEEAHPDPLTSGEYLIPPNATTIAPPQFDITKQTAQWDGTAWTLGNINYQTIGGVTVEINEWAQIQQLAQGMLDKSDIVVLRAYEDSVPVTADWIAYRKALRAIVSAPDGDITEPLPLQPATYPEVTQGE